MVGYKYMYLPHVLFMDMTVYDAMWFMKTYYYNICNMTCNTVIEYLGMIIASGSY